MMVYEEPRLTVVRPDGLPSPNKLFTDRIVPELAVTSLEKARLDTQ